MIFIYILVTINRNYIYPLIIMLYSLIKNNPYPITVFIMNKDLTDDDIHIIKENVDKRIEIRSIKIDDRKLQGAPVSKKFPITMYYRLFAYKYLPKNIDRILYLDPDIIIKGNLMELYHLDMTDSYYIAATHVGCLVKYFNDIRLKIKHKNIYVNSGVLLMNLKALRKSFINENVIYNYIDKNKRKLFLPDQDVLSKLYQGKIKQIDASIYNFTEKMLKKYSLDWVDKNTKIIHYCGKNKPWKKKYYGMLNKYYLQYEKEAQLKKE